MKSTRRQFLFTSAASAMAAQGQYDVAVYGATACGVMAAIEAARSGLRVVLIEPGKHIGGMTSGGLGATDFGRKASVGGLAREFYQRVKKVYLDPARWKYGTLPEYKAPNGHYVPTEDTMWTFEPHVAEEVFRGMLRETKVETVFGQRLQLRSGVSKNGPRIDSITMESGRRFAAAVYVDASYEGDLMAKAGVSYAVGRESNSQYGETWNGVQSRKWTKAAGGEFGAHFPRAVDPYVKPGNPSSGLLFGVHERELKPDGTGDKKVQAYTFRLCLTDVPENSAPFRKPEGYDPRRYELLRRLLTSSQRFPEYPSLPDPDHPVLGSDPTVKMMPNRKTDLNTKGGMGSDYVGANWDYPDGDYAKREGIWKDHVAYHQGLIWFVATDPRVPERYRSKMQGWGYAADEFGDTAHWPHQLYIREGRRMIGEYVMTEHTCQGKDVPEDGVALASYAIDSHMTSRYVDEKGRVQNEGHVLTSGMKPYPVSYRAITPRRTECSNLLAPVCLSATHTAYGSVRMEPVFMVLGQSAGAAAAIAAQKKLGVQQLPYGELRTRLVERGLKVQWTSS